MDIEWHLHQANEQDLVYGFFMAAAHCVDMNLVSKLVIFTGGRFPKVFKKTSLSEIPKSATGTALNANVTLGNDF